LKLFACGCSSNYYSRSKMVTHPEGTAGGSENLNTHLVAGIKQFVWKWCVIFTDKKEWRNVYLYMCMLFSVFPFRTKVKYEE